MNVGVEKIDAQHRKLIAILNDLDSAIVTGQEDSKLDGILVRLADYVNYHFSEEESFMESIGYPEIGEHKREHASFAKKIEGYRKDDEEQIGYLAQKTLNMVKDWLIGHIMNSDKKYGLHFMGEPS